MNSYYEQIMKLKEAADFKKIIIKWNNLSHNLSVSPKRKPILLPDMLWIAKSGVGKTNLLKLLSEYLFECGNLIEFYGDVKYFEFMLNYCYPEEPFTEIQRLMDEISNAAGFRNEYKGIIYIDINEWVGHVEEKHFISFMEYISNNSDDWLIILGVAGDEKDKVEQLEAFVSMYLRIEKIKLTLPKTEDLFEYIEKILSDYELELAPDAKLLIHKTIEELRKNKYFDGFKTIKMLCQDIGYYVFSLDSLSTNVLTAEMLADFSFDSEYVKRTVSKIENIRKIGFNQ